GRSAGGSAGVSPRSSRSERRVGARRHGCYIGRSIHESAAWTVGGGAGGAARRAVARRRQEGKEEARVQGPLRRHLLVQEDHAERQAEGRVGGAEEGV